MSVEMSRDDDVCRDVDAYRDVCRDVDTYLDDDDCRDVDAC
jgi:hypothetical protein